MLSNVLMCLQNSQGQNVKERLPLVMGDKESFTQGRFSVGKCGPWQKDETWVESWGWLRTHSIYAWFGWLIENSALETLDHASKAGCAFQEQGCQESLFYALSVHCGSKLLVEGPRDHPGIRILCIVWHHLLHELLVPCPTNNNSLFEFVLSHLCTTAHVIFSVDHSLPSLPCASLATQATMLLKHYCSHASLSSCSILLIKEWWGALPYSSISFG